MNDDFLNKITSDLMTNMGIAMIQQGLPDSTEMPWDMTLGDFKKMGGLTDQDIKLLQSEQN
tara:strand:- start:2558 stop:2740 length:183 start_codon:yes stop_codon:yes gene_type:complete